MTTNIPEGTIVKMRHRGDWQYAMVVRLPRNPDGTISGVKTTPTIPGDFGIQLFIPSEDQKKTAIRAVWKDAGTRLEGRI